MKHQLRRLKRCLTKSSNVDSLTKQFLLHYKWLKGEYCEDEGKDGRKSLSNKEVNYLMGVALRRFFKTMTH